MYAVYFLRAAQVRRILARAARLDKLAISCYCDRSQLNLFGVRLDSLTELEYRQGATDSYINVQRRINSAPNLRKLTLHTPVTLTSDEKDGKDVDETKMTRLINLPHLKVLEFAAVNQEFVRRRVEQDRLLLLFHHDTLNSIEELTIDQLSLIRQVAGRKLAKLTIAGILCDEPNFAIEMASFQCYPALKTLDIGKNYRASMVPFPQLIFDVPPSVEQLHACIASTELFEIELPLPDNAFKGKALKWVKLGYIVRQYDFDYESLLALAQPLIDALAERGIRLELKRV